MVCVINNSWTIAQIAKSRQAAKNRGNRGFRDFENFFWPYNLGSSVWTLWDNVRQACIGSSRCESAGRTDRRGDRRTETVLPSARPASACLSWNCNKPNNSIHTETTTTHITFSFHFISEFISHHSSGPIHRLQMVQNGLVFAFFFKAITRNIKSEWSREWVRLLLQVIPQTVLHTRQSLAQVRTTKTNSKINQTNTKKRKIQ